MKKKIEVWTREDWITTIALCIVFLPIGLVALMRRYSGQRVWH